MSANKIPVLEVFGPTIQGEGMMIGRKTVFVRTAGCDFKCSWCDSAFTWDGSAKDQIKMMSPGEIVAEVSRVIGEKKTSCDHVTISGGNPALIGFPMEMLIDSLHEDGVEFRVGLETQGSVWQSWMTKIDDLTLSPKPPSSMMAFDGLMFAWILQNLNFAKTNYSVKVVVFNDEDFEFAKRVRKAIARLRSVPFYLQVGNTEHKMPVDEQSPNIEWFRSALIDKYEWLSNKVLADSEMSSVITLPQLHTLVWGNKRGV